MELFSYSDICSALGPIWGEMASDPRIQSAVCKFLAFQSNSGMKNALYVDSENGVLKIECSKRVFCSVVLVVNQWLAERWDPAEDVYYEIFNPIKKNEVELDSEEYKNIKRNNTIVKPNKNTLKYFDWYSYMNNNTVTTHAFNESLKAKDFPVLTKKL